MALDHAICKVEVRCDPEMQADCHGQEAERLFTLGVVRKDGAMLIRRIGSVVVVVAIPGDRSRNATINHRHRGE